MSTRRPLGSSSLGSGRSAERASRKFMDHLTGLDASGTAKGRMVRSQHAVDPGGEAGPGLLASRQLLPPGVGQLVVLPPPAIGLAPDRAQQLLSLQPVERRVERPLL